MSLIVKETSSYEPAPAGAHLARCVQVVDLGMQEGMYGQKHQVWIQWELPEELMDDGRPFTIGRRYTVSLNAKSALRYDLESWRGRPFTSEELRGFDLQKVLNTPCQVNVVHRARDDGSMRAQINGIMPKPKNSIVPEAISTLLYYDLDTSDPAALAKMPDWMQEVIANAGKPSIDPNVRAILDGQGAPRGTAKAAQITPTIEPREADPVKPGVNVEAFTKDVGEAKTVDHVQDLLSSAYDMAEDEAQRQQVTEICQARIAEIEA